MCGCGPPFVERLGSAGTSRWRCSVDFRCHRVVDDDRDFWEEFTVALRFVGLLLMGLEFVLVARLKAVAAPFGEDALLPEHLQREGHQLDDARATDRPLPVL